MFMQLSCSAWLADDTARASWPHCQSALPPAVTYRLACNCPYTVKAMLFGSPRHTAALGTQLTVGIDQAHWEKEGQGIEAQPQHELDQPAPMVQKLVPRVALVLDAHQHSGHQGKEQLQAAQEWHELVTCIAAWCHRRAARSQQQTWAVDSAFMTHTSAVAMDGNTHEVAHAETVHGLLPVPAVANVSSGLVHNPCK